MDTLKMCMWHFVCVWTFFENFTWNLHYLHEIYITWSFFQHVLHRWYLHCVINSFCTSRMTLFKPLTIVIDILKMCMWCFGSVRTFFFWKIYMKLNFYTSILAGGRLPIGYILCVINSTHTLRLTFFKPCTVVVDTLKMCMWLCRSFQTFFEKFTCSWTWSFFQHVLHRWYLLCVVNSSHLLDDILQTCTVVMDTLKICMWLFWKCMDTILKIYM
jgi:hypothetical protein